MKVVMVDDSAADRNLCRILLQEVHGPGLEFFGEQRASMGLDTCRQVQPDCLLLDYKLSEMTGLEFLRRLREGHHRVKNNLQVIASLLRLQAGAMGSPELTAALEDSQHRVESMALVHEQLYESSDLREVDLAKHVTQLMTNLFDSYGVDSA